MTLGERMVLLRKQKGWSSGKLACEAGIARGYVWQLETGGKEKPSLDILERLARALGVPVADLVEPPPSVSKETPLPPGLAKFVNSRGRYYGVTKTDVEVMRGVHFRGEQPEEPEDWELLYLFLRKWVR